MKFLAWIFSILAIIIGGVYTIAFTSFGNSIVKPMIEEQIKAQTKLDSKLSTFSLSMSKLDIVLELNKNNTVALKGDYSIFSQSFDIDYDVKLKELKTLKTLTGTDLRKSFFTSGNVEGDMAFIKVNGNSDVASSETTYKVELTDLNPTSIIAKVSHLDLATLLDMGVQKPYADANVNLDVNFKSIKTHALDGDIALRTLDGKLNPKVMKNDFNITIPKTNFTMNLDAKLKGDDVDYTYDFLSNLFKIKSDGVVTPEPLKLDVKYGVDVKELAVLKPMTGADVRGPFRLNGTAKGTKAKLVVDGKSDVASSDTRFAAILKDFAPASVKATIKNLRLEKVLYMVKQPHYTDGRFNMVADISDARVGHLKGNIKTNIKNGLLDSRYMTKAYKFKSKMPTTKYTLNTYSTLNKNMVDTKVDLSSTLANLNIKSAKFNMDTSSLVSDYKAKVLNLDKLYFVTQQHMRGSIVATGDVKKAKDLDFTMHSNVVGGKVDAKLHNDDFHADIKSIQTMDALHMLIYPEVFKSSLDAKVDYNLATSKGVFDGHLIDGKFAKNQMFDLLKQFAKTDLYREKFAGDVGAKLNKEKILASFDLKSRTASIVSKKTTLNSKTKAVNSKIDIVANKHPLSVKITGTTDKPKVTLDAKELMKAQAKKELLKKLGKNKKAAKLLEKNPEIGNLLKGLF
jgi:hypothetical protein